MRYICVAGGKNDMSRQLISQAAALTHTAGLFSSGMVQYESTVKMTVGEDVVLQILSRVHRAIVDGQ